MMLVKNFTASSDGDGDEQMREAPRRFFEGTDEVQTPDCEWPGDQNRLEGLRWEMCLPSEELIAFAALHDFFGIGHRCWPVEALPKGFSDQGSRSSVVAADSSVNVLQELLALSDGDASLQNPGGATIVELTLDEGEGFCAVCHPPSFFLALRQFTALEAVSKRDPPVGCRGSWCQDRVDLHHVPAWFFG
jgi:hypothetical protein